MVTLFPVVALVVPPQSRPPHPSLQARTPSTELPVPIPVDAPLDELIEPPSEPRVDDVPADYRDVFFQLERNLRALRECAAHEALSVKWDAGVDEIRNGYFALTKQFHPDVVGRYRSDAITGLAQEVFININKAYDRMRDAAVAKGEAIVAGPALLKHKGWLAGFEDIGTQPSRTPMSKPTRPKREPAVYSKSAPAKKNVTVRFGGKGTQATPPPTPAPQPSPMQRRADTLSADALFGDVEMEQSSSIDLSAPSGDKKKLRELEASAREDLAAERCDEAREALAAALEIDPRNRSLRALYHVAYGKQLAAEGKPTEARNAVRGSTSSRSGV